ncbi:hypothetical protein GCM10025734_23760 [Kitasatospora paranensis]
MPKSESKAIPSLLSESRLTRWTSLYCTVVASESIVQMPALEPIGRIAMSYAVLCSTSAWSAARTTIPSPPVSLTVLPRKTTRVLGRQLTVLPQPSPEP